MVFCLTCSPSLNACLLAREEEMMEAGVRRRDISYISPHTHIYTHTVTTMMGMLGKGRNTWEWSAGERRE